MSRIAREHLVTDAKPVYIPDRVGPNAPIAEVGGTARVHGPEVAVSTANIKNVYVAVNQEDTVLAISLLFKQVEHVSEVGLDLPTEFHDDQSVQRRTLQPADDQIDFGNVLLDLVMEELIEDVVGPTNFILK